MRTIVLFLQFLTPLILFSQGDIEYIVKFKYDEFGNVSKIIHPKFDLERTDQIREQIYTYNALNGHNTVDFRFVNPDGSVINQYPQVASTSYNPMEGVNEMVLFPNWKPNDFRGNDANRYYYNYDDLDRLENYGAIIGGNNFYTINSMEYDNWNYLTSESKSFNYPETGNPTNLDLAYSYDELGQMDQYTLNGQSINYRYDNSGNLESRTPEINTTDYYLSSINNQSYNRKNQNSDPSFVYSPEGKLLETANDKYTYNALEQIRKVEDKTISQNQEKAAFLYDGDGERVREVYENKVVYTIRGLNNEVLSQEIHSRASAGNDNKLGLDYVYHNSQHLTTFLIPSFGGSELELQPYFSFRDRLGSVAFTINTAFDWWDGYKPITEYFHFAPFGTELTAKKTPFYGVGHGLPEFPEFAFTGHERDRTVGLDYMHARYYDSNFGHFCMPDPAYDFNLTNPSTFNLYSYSRNNPINFIDPQGTAVLRLVGFEKRWSWLPDWYADYGPFGMKPIYQEVIPPDPNSLFNVFMEGLSNGWQTGLAEAGTRGVMKATRTGRTVTSVNDKLNRYLLNSKHPIGGAKAAFFKRALGFKRGNLLKLAKQFKFDLKKADLGELTIYGQKYTQVIPIKGLNGRIINVKTAWIRSNKDGVIRLITAVPAK